MKVKYIAIAMAVVLGISLMGCSRKNVEAKNSPSPTQRPTATVPGNQEQNNDALDGGGAGGTNDTNKDNHSTATPETSPQVSGDGVLDNIGDAAGDLVEGAGDAIQDAGNAIGNAADNITGNSGKATR